MNETWHSHLIVDPESFAIRRPVLEAMGDRWQNRWRLSGDGREMSVDIPLSSLSRTQRAMVEFAINPFVMAENIFGGLDGPVRRSLAKAIHDYFGPGGPGDR